MVTQDNNYNLEYGLIKSEHLEWSSSNVYKKLYDANLDHVLAIFDKNDLYVAQSTLARLLSVNFAANNSTLTLKFKQQPTITADEITATEFAKAKRLGINVYTYFDDAAMIAEGTVIGGKFAMKSLSLTGSKMQYKKKYLLVYTNHRLKFL